MKRQDVKSHCPVNAALEAVGDTWSLLIIRDIASYGKHTFGEFLESKEGISTRMLAMCLARLEELGIITHRSHPTDKRRVLYELTSKGESLIPVLIELATWGATFDADTSAPQAWKDAVAADKRAAHPAQAARRPFFANGSL
jgi:DNA-binding HxlR family transcriptional regulator